MRYFVHVYHTVRSKLLVEADDHKSAMAQADAALPAISKRVQFAMLSSLEEEQKLAPLFEAGQLPLHLQTESAEEVTAYLVDEVGDSDYEKSTSYDASGIPALSLTPVERDTVLAALRFWQRQGNSPDLPEWDVATCGGEHDTHEVLDDEAIDDLCERLNA